MGQNASSEQKHGYHVLKVIPGSPAAKAGLIPFFDYIVAVNKTLLDEQANSLIKVISDNVNNRLSFYVYSSKTNTYRNVKFEFPIEKWTASGENGWLGFSVRYCSYDGAAEHFWHVLAVVKDFPAFMAGIQPKTDYIIGSPNHILKTQTDLYDLFDEYINKPLHLYVYSTVTNKCREIIVIPTAKNGEGCIGCTFSYGDRISVKDILKNKEEQQKLQLDQNQQPSLILAENSNESINQENNIAPSPKSEEINFNIMNITKKSSTEQTKNENDENKKTEELSTKIEDKNEMPGNEIKNNKKNSLINYMNTMPSPYVQSLDNSIKNLFPKKSPVVNPKSFEYNEDNLNYEFDLNELSRISHDEDNLSALDKLSEFEAATKENSFSLRPNSSRLNLPSQKNEEKKESPLQNALTINQNEKENKKDTLKPEEEIDDFIKTPEQFLNELFLKEFHSTPTQNNIDMSFFSGSNDTKNELNTFNKLSENSFENNNNNNENNNAKPESFDFNSIPRNNEFDHFLSSNPDPNTAKGLNIYEPSGNTNSMVNQIPIVNIETNNDNYNVIETSKMRNNPINDESKIKDNTVELSPIFTETNNIQNSKTDDDINNIINSLPVPEEKKNTKPNYAINDENYNITNSFPINTVTQSALDPFPVNIETQNPLNQLPINTEIQNPFDQVPVNSEVQNPLEQLPVNTEIQNSFDQMPINTEVQNPLNQLPVNTEIQNPLNQLPVNTEIQNSFDQMPINTEIQNPLDQLPVNTEIQNPLDQLPVNTENQNTLDQLPVNTEINNITDSNPNKNEPENSLNLHTLNEFNSKLNSLPVNSEQSNINPLPIDYKQSNINTFPINYEENDINPFPQNSEQGDINPFPINSEQSNINPLPVNSEQSSINPLPVNSEQSNINPLPVNYEKRDINSFPINTEQSVINTLSINNDINNPNIINQFSMTNPIKSSDYSPKLNETTDIKQSAPIQNDLYQSNDTNNMGTSNSNPNNTEIPGNDILNVNDQKTEEKKDESTISNDVKQNNRISFIHDNLFKTTGKNDEFNFFDQMNSNDNYNNNWNFDDSFSEDKSGWNFASPNMLSINESNQNTPSTSPPKKESSGWNFNTSTPINQNDQNTLSTSPPKKEFSGWNFGTSTPINDISYQNTSSTTSTPATKKEQSGWNFSMPSVGISNQSTPIITSTKNEQNFNNVSEQNKPKTSNTEIGWNFNNMSSFNTNSQMASTSTGWNLENNPLSVETTTSNQSQLPQQQQQQQQQNTSEWNFNMPMSSASPINTSAPQKQESNSWTFANDIIPNKQASPKLLSPELPATSTPSSNVNDILMNDNNNTNQSKSKEPSQNLWDFNDSIPFDTNNQGDWDFTRAINSNTNNNQSGWNF